MMSDDVSRIEMLLREHFAQTDKQIAEMKADNAEFHALMMKEMGSFKTEVRQDIDTFKSEVRQDIKEFKTEVRQDLASVRHEIQELKAETVELQRDVTGLKHDVQGLYHWDYWLLSIILVVFAMPQIVAGLKALFSAIAEGIAGIVSAFRGGRPGGQ